VKQQHIEFGLGGKLARSDSGSVALVYPRCQDLAIGNATVSGYDGVDPGLDLHGALFLTTPSWTKSANENGENTRFS